MPKTTRSSTPKKARWTPAQKAEAKRASAKGAKKPHHRGQAPAPATDKKREYAGRPAREGGSPRRFERPEQPGRPARRDVARFERPAPTASGRGERATRPARPEFDRVDRPTRRFDGGERPARREFDRVDRPTRRFDGSDRAARRFDGSDRPARRFDGGERPPRREFERSSYGDRRRFDRTNADVERAQRHAEAEAERSMADTWTKATRASITGPVEVAEDNGFAALGLSERLVERLARDGITSPFPIQAATIPDALAGRDVLGRGQTGSGKTLAFGLPTLTRLSGRQSTPKRPRALVLVPTRELAMQVSDALEPLVHVIGLRHKLVAGGLSYATQIAALDRGVDLLIATPGRLRDLLDRGAVELRDVEVAVLDEADHMADMGFLPEVTSILDEVPAGGQRLLFSATLDNGIDTLVERYLSDPVTHSTDEAKASVSTMAHHALLIEPTHKKVITAHVANRKGRTLVFVRTKLGADRVAMQLREQGVLAAALHGGLTQNARNRVLGAFRDGTLPVLVATDVAARGIHVDDVSVVLQVDPPADHKDYLHRSGRTARAGEEGTVVTLALPHQRRTMERQLRDAGVDIPLVKVAPGDAVLTATGASEPTGVPVSDDEFRRIVEGPKSRRAGQRPGGQGPRRRPGGERRDGQRRDGQRRDGQRQGRDSRSGFVRAPRD